MPELDILLPFALPPIALGADLLRAMETPALALLLGRALSHQHKIFDAFAHALPHETWLARAVGLPVDSLVSSSPPITLLAMQRFGAPADYGVWFIVNPVHLHVARDHLVLTDRRRLNLSEAESHALFDVAEPLFAEVGQRLVFGDAQTWFLQADSWNDLQTATPDATCGHNIDIWMPKGPTEREWRKIQNEVQMRWHDCPTNQLRAAHGKQVVNALWLWGGASAAFEALAPTYRVLCARDGALPEWCPDSRVDVASVEQLLASVNATSTPQGGRALLVLDDLIAPALAEDYAEWLARFNALERLWLAPIAAALRNNTLRQCRLILTNGTVITEATVPRARLRRFWNKPTLAGLLA